MIKNLKSPSKNLVFFAASILTIFSLFPSCKEGNIKIKGNLINGGNRIVVLKEMTSSEILTVDSIQIDSDGDFKLTAKATRPAFYTFYLSKEQNITLIIQPGEKISITGDANDLANTYQVEGSKDCLGVKELNDQLKQTLKKVDDLRKIYQDSLGSANILGIRSMLDSMYNSIEREHQIYTLTFIRKNIQSMASLMALYQQLGPRKPVLNPKDHFEYFAMVDSSMMINFPEADASQSLHSLMSEVNEQHRRQIEQEKRTAVGVAAPEIVLPSFKGDSLKLSLLKGKYVLLDFWASWCAPCRSENPQLTKFYWRYKYAGFEIFQVSLDKSRDAWLKAITTDGLAWQHVSDLKMWNSPVAALYGIESIPSNFLLNKEGVIIAKNLHGEELAAKLKEIFKY